MRILTKRICALILALQVTLLMPLPAQANSLLDTILDALALVQPWPLPITPGELKSLMHVLEACTDTSDEGLLACADASANDSTIGGAIGSTASDNLVNFVKIYIDIKHGDYIQLIIDAGEPLGCAAAQVIAGGFDVCGAMKALIAVGEALVEVAGEIGDAAESWFKELDTAFDDLTGQTIGALDPPAYYQNWFMPYTRDFVAKAVAASVDDNTLVMPYLVFHVGGPQSYTEAGLFQHSVSGMHAKCETYYKNKNKEGKAGEICAKLRQQFQARTAFLAGAAKQMRQFGTMAAPLLAAYQAGFRTQIKQFDEANGSNIDLTQGAGNEFNAGYLAQLAYRVGTPKEHTWCAPGANNECFDSWYGSPGSSVAGQAFEAVVQSNFSLPPKAALDQAMAAAKPGMQSVVDNYKKGKLAQAAKLSADKRLEKLRTLVFDSSHKLHQFASSCKALLKPDSKWYAERCLQSEPLKACQAYRDSFFSNQTLAPNLVDYNNPVAFNLYYDSAAQKLGNCIAGTGKVVAEWQRMHQLSDAWRQGWTDRCKAKIKNDPDYCDKNAPFPLGISWEACVEKAIAKVAPGGNRLREIPGPGRIDTSIVGGFCSTSGAAVVASLVASHGKPIFGGDPVRPDPVDPSKRDPAKVALMAKIKAQNRACSFGRTRSGPDNFKLVCTTKAAHDACLSNFTDVVENRMARTCATAPGDAGGYVTHPCCSLQPRFGGPVR